MRLLRTYVLNNLEIMAIIGHNYHCKLSDLVDYNENRTYLDLQVTQIILVHPKCKSIFLLYQRAKFYNTPIATLIFSLLIPV